MARPPGSAGTSLLTGTSISVLIRTPMFDDPASATRNLVRPWVIFFERLARSAASPGIVTTHAARVSFSPADYSTGTLLTETDRAAIYQNRTVGSALAWVWLSGEMRDTSISPDNRPIDLGANDAGFAFYSTDAFLLYRWSGTAWEIQITIEPQLVDTHANRLANFPSTRYAEWTPFVESDRLATYFTAPSTGTVNTSGTAVTWVSGNKFDNAAGNWQSGPITINGVVYAVASVTNATHLVLTASAGTQSGVAYSVEAGRWIYASGTMQAAWASLPTDLGANDIGFLFYDNTDSLHIWQWTGTAWIWGPGNRASGEMAEFDGDPGTGWHLCDGTGSLTKYAADGTRNASFTVPNRGGFYTKGGAYTGTGVAAASPAALATGANVTLNVSTANIGTGAGAPATLVSAVSINAITQPTITLEVPPVDTFATLYYYRL